MSALSAQPYSGAIRPAIHPGAKVRDLHLLLVIALSITAAVWGTTLITGGSGYELGKFLSLAGFFGVACALFVVSRAAAGFHSLFEIPVFMTVMAFVEFAAAPLVALLDPEVLSPNLRGDTSLYQPALQIVIAGMVAFWLGAGIARSRKQPSAVLDHASLPGSRPHFLTVAFGGCLYLAGLVARVYMLRVGMYSPILGSMVVFETHRAETQVWIVISFLGTYALVLFCIEMYHHPGDRIRRLLFWALFVSECFWGLISGMKEGLLINFVVLAVVSSFTKRMLRMRWLALVILGLIIIYPLTMQYRSIVRRTPTGTESTTSLSEASEAMLGAAERTAGREQTTGGWLASGWARAVSRVNMLDRLALMLANQDRSYLLEGDEHLWMIPYYPLIPRFLWPAKPVQDYGGRFTKLLGGTDLTATSPTIPGDLYVMHYGIAGVLVGMFLLGLGVQWLTNPVTLRPSKRNLFIYAGLFYRATYWENDAFVYWTNLIRAFIILQIIAFIVYGPPQVLPRLGTKRQGRK